MKIALINENSQAAKNGITEPTPTFSACFGQACR